MIVLIHIRVRLGSGIYLLIEICSRITVYCMPLYRIYRKSTLHFLPVIYILFGPTPTVEDGAAIYFHIFIKLEFQIHSSKKKRLVPLELPYPKGFLGG